MAQIYALIDPVTDEIRYIGKTIRALQSRLKDHLYDKTICHRTNWIKSLTSPPKIILIESCEESIWQERERFWISFYVDQTNLVNETGGGDGMSRMLPATRLKISQKLKGVKRPCTETRRLAIIHGKTGRPNGLLGKRFSTQHCLNISESKRGKPSPLKGIKRPQELIRKTTETRKRNFSFPNALSVIHVPTNTRFRSVGEASQSTSIPKTTIRRKTKIGKEWFIPTDVQEIKP